MDLIEFLKARLGEDEEDARAAAVRAESWTFDESRMNAAIVTSTAAWESTAGSGVWDCDDPDDDCGEYRAEMCAEGEHIARWDPARVLAEVEDWRNVLTAWEIASREPGPAASYAWVLIRDVVIRPRLARYADHPDFDPAWLSRCPR